MGIATAIKSVVQPSSFSTQTHLITSFSRWSAHTEGGFNYIILGSAKGRFWGELDREGCTTENKSKKREMLLGWKEKRLPSRRKDYFSLVSPSLHLITSVKWVMGIIFGLEVEAKPFWSPSIIDQTHASLSLLHWHYPPIYSSLAIVTHYFLTCHHLPFGYNYGSPNGGYKGRHRGH